MIIISKHKSCLGCISQRKQYCWWFSPPRRIPNKVFDKGCKFRTGKKADMNKIAQYIVDKFKGELI